MQIDKLTTLGVIEAINKLKESSNVNSRYYEDVSELHELVKQLDKNLTVVYNLPEND